MGSGLARRIAIAGHDVLMTAKNLMEAEKIAKQIGPRVKSRPTEVAKGVDILIAAAPAGEQVNALNSCGDLAGKIVIDIANPLKPDMSGLSAGSYDVLCRRTREGAPGREDREGI